jgi:SH3 domain-containing YSC84-like protein 1
VNNYRSHAIQSEQSKTSSFSTEGRVTKSICISQEKIMKNQLLLSFVIALGLICISSGANLASADDKDKIKDASEQSGKAAKVFTEIMNAPDNAVPSEIMDKAECVAVFPSVIKAGFIVGGRGGRGVVSCRTPQGWSAPAFLNLGGGSVGLQIGAQATDFVMLFMNKDGVNSLLSSKFTLGGDASVAAGPVGRQAGASTDAAMKAQILSYSRSRGAFAGLELKGVAITIDDSDMKGVYGNDVTAKEVLQENKRTAPEGVQDFPQTLGKYSTRQAQK